MATLIKKYYVEPGEFISESLTGGGLVIWSQGSNPSPPAWFDFVTHVVYGYAGFEFTVPDTIGTQYKIYLDGANFGGTFNYYIEINVIAARLTAYSNCCGTNPRNITWFNIQGGWQNYIFNGIKTFEVDIDNSKQFKTSGLIKKHSQISGVYNGELITSGDIPQSHVDALDTLRYAIQAYLLNTESGLWDIPILLDIESFTKYKSRDKFYDVRIKFIYAEEILVQSQ